MKMRTLALLLLASCAAIPAPEREPLKPNIIYLMLDEWGYYEWSGAGHPILETPNIDRFASEGIRFTQALAGGNVCAPTRCALLTGRHTGHCTVRTNGGGTSIRADEKTLGDVLKSAGYATGGFGKWGIGDAGTSGVPERHGFDLFYGYYHQVHAHTYYPRYLLRNGKKEMLEGNTGAFHGGKSFSHERIYRESVTFIRQNKDRPFFAYLPWTPPHGLWGMPEDEPAWIKYKDRDLGGKNQRGKHDVEMYGAMMEMVDRQVGEILALLKELGIAERTIFFLCGDNGGQPYFRTPALPDGVYAPNRDPKTGVRFRGGKGVFYEGGLRVPMMVRWPGRIKPGRTSDLLWYYPDVMPTLAELAGAEVPKECDGISIVPTLLGRGEQKTHEYLYWEDRGSMAVRMGTWKLIRPKKSRSLELYDLSKDIEEKNNVAEAHPEVVARMKAFAEAAHEDPRPGKVLDPSAAFKKAKK
jgi:arylsulfatase A-like enzyme